MRSEVRIVGRTVPSFRQLLEQEVERLQRLADGSTDPGRRRALTDLLGHARDLENEYASAGGDPTEEILLALLLHTYTASRTGKREEPE